MNNLEKFLDNRKKEIDQYFIFLEKLDIDNNSSYTVSVYGDYMKEEECFELSKTHTQILKSNAVLLLYNSVEGTVYNSLNFIIDKVNNEQLNYQNVISQIQKIWLNSKFPIGTDLEELGFEKIFERMHDLLNSKIEIDIVEFRTRNKGYFGKSNINDDVIHEEVFPKIGLSTAQKITESKLEDIKNHRNDLAHGNSSFAELGSKITYSSLEDHKNKVFRYLEKYVERITDYVNQQKYKVS